LVWLSCIKWQGKKLGDVGNCLLNRPQLKSKRFLYERLHYFLVVEGDLISSAAVVFKAIHTEITEIKSKLRILRKNLHSVASSNH
jgi:hypothetical protein